MKILVLNCGSSSIKYQLFDMATAVVLAKGIVEKIGLKGSFLKNERFDGDKVKLEGEILDHQTGIEYLLGMMVSKKRGVIKDLNEIDAVGHRLVHGGELFQESCYLDDVTIKGVENCSDLAPLHNPANLKGIYAMKSVLPNVPQVGVFDTSFHQTMPDYSFMYALPYSLYKKYGIRRYGFHGTSHSYVSKRACEILNVDYKSKKIITCHLGNGASITAIKDGKSLDTSMGLTPVEGLIMGTRSGDVDAGALTLIMEKEEIDFASLNTLLNKHSGVLGVSGISSDMREIESAAAEGDERAILALKMYEYRVKKYIGAYAAAMGGVDILIFTGGIGENGSETRENICKDFEFIGIDFDKSVNEGVRGKELVISKKDSKVTVMIVPTNEEFVIASETRDIVDARKAK
ncbi:MAG: acetate kinase [Bacteroidales bacterium]|nr:acetate kinase [Bacteroidales bacterium]MBK7627611.1 acetate kinase [Bacteroidales bacterium]